MALYVATTEGEVAVTSAGGDRCVLWVYHAATPVTRPQIVSFTIAFDGTTVTNEPVLVTLARTSTAGTGTGVTEEPFDTVNPTSQMTAAKYNSASPTKGNVLYADKVHPQGSLTIQFPLGERPAIPATLNNGIGIYCTAGADVNAVANILWDE